MLFYAFRYTLHSILDRARFSPFPLSPSAVHPPIHPLVGSLTGSTLSPPFFMIPPFPNFSCFWYCLSNRHWVKTESVFSIPVRLSTNKNLSQFLLSMPTKKYSSARRKISYKSEFTFVLPLYFLPNLSNNVLTRSLLGNCYLHTTR